MNEQEIETDTDDTEGNVVGSRHIETGTAETDDTAGNSARAHPAPAIDTDDVEGNAISPRRAFPNTTKPGRAIGSRH